MRANARSASNQRARFVVEVVCCGGFLNAGSDWIDELGSLP